MREQVSEKKSVCGLIFTLDALIEKCYFIHAKLCVAFIDFHKAFDIVQKKMYFPLDSFISIWCPRWYAG